MIRYLIRRLLASLITLLGVSAIVFLLLHLLPGDPARLIAGMTAPQEEVVRLRTQLGLDDPLWLQYWRFLTRLVQGDLGTSIRSAAPVLNEILGRMPWTILLAVTSTLLATAIGIPAGVLAARYRNSLLDYAVSLATLFGISMPVYWLGLVLIILFAVQLHLLPAGGNEQPTSLILPTLTLAAFSVALIARMTRSSMLEVLGQDYLRTARAKWLRERAVVFRHALKNAFIPVVTVIGLQLGMLLSGSVLTETVFGWPGIGQLLVDSIFARDYPVVQGVVMVFAVIFTLLNILVDLLYAYLDPRIHYA
jgi:peptide/nickel transport system permease protein/oligopeptide transport system permease protein